MEDLDLDQLEEVDSSNIESVGTRDSHLVVKFRSGPIYAYRDMAHMFFDLISSESVGRFFDSNVRHMTYERLRNNQWPDNM